MIDRKKVGEAIYRSRHSEWRGFIPRSIELKYWRMGEAAINAVKEQIDAS